MKEERCVRRSGELPAIVCKTEQSESEHTNHNTDSCYRPRHKENLKVNLRYFLVSWQNGVDEKAQYVPEHLASGGQKSRTKLRSTRSRPDG